MKLKNVILSTIFLSLALNIVNAGDRASNNSEYRLEHDYPSGGHRYSREELDQARRRANNSTWLRYYGKNDPIYNSDQYRGISRGRHRTSSNSEYRLEHDYPSGGHRYSREELDQARRRANNSTWLRYYGKNDPIYNSDQYRGISRGYQR